LIVWVASYPRSGNRLCRATLRQAFGTPHVGSAANKAALRNDLSDLFERLGVSQDDDLLAALRDFDEPVFLKTHSLPQYIHTLPEPRTTIPEGEEDSPALYLVRDGRDCFVSYAHYLKEVDNRPRFKTMNIDEVLEWLVTDAGPQGGPFGGWSGNVRGWRERSAPTAILRFEDLRADPAATIEAGANELGVELPPRRADAPTFEQMKERSRRPDLVRSGKTGSWRTEFPPQLLEEFWTRHGEQMDALGYSRD
jgi:hypothetical protein